jgi:hypothetical protein
MTVDSCNPETADSLQIETSRGTTFASGATLKGKGSDAPESPRPISGEGEFNPNLSERSASALALSSSPLLSWPLCSLAANAVSSLGPNFVPPFSTPETAGV